LHIDVVNGVFASQLVDWIQFLCQIRPKD